MPVFLATKEADNRRMQFKDSLGEQFVRPKSTIERAGRVSQVMGPKFKLQYLQKKKRQTKKDP
jgi:hypothetical protein